MFTSKRQREELERLESDVENLKMRIKVLECSHDKHKFQYSMFVGYNSSCECCGKIIDTYNSGQDMKKAEVTYLQERAKAIKVEISEASK